ncbi:endothelial cell-specific molecule 1 precursor [Danio rerio]|uniref:Endothelial cell-specific molecule 1 precursor n=1 Tax=Danio rerio TaxID=7955 RepID=Q08CJ3_DANRE|nr:endothelial cell-specific molecule 1 precursor [Danio rerio]AAI24218.1 Zgc:153027 [Danio rerio]AAI64957.1 Zgc:153027 protein [Danio rerio]|eukprot:NP_001070209.1 endothelial cell-specific molecule 1 precursor [Danio rerio]
MRVFAILMFVLMVVFGETEAWGPGGKYAVNCPDKCNPALCGSTLRCRRTVLDDCGCCQVCAAGRGEHCYRTVSGMHGVKCGPGLFCDFYKDEDDYGDEYGICKDCMFGTYGMECRKTCDCKAGGLCDRETGACLSFKVLAKMAMLKSHSNEAGNEVGSGDTNTESSSSRASARNFLTPR